MENLERWQSDIERRFREAFPIGDHLGHCRYHQLMIEEIEGRKALKKAIVEKTLGGLAWAAVCAIALAMWQWIKSQVGAK